MKAAATYVSVPYASGGIAIAVNNPSGTRRDPLVSRRDPHVSCRDPPGSPQSTPRHSTSQSTPRHGTPRSTSCQTTSSNVLSGYPDGKCQYLPSILMR